VCEKVWKCVKEENVSESLLIFEVVEASNSISWMGFLLDNLFLCFGHCGHRECSHIPVGTNCVVYLANFYRFSYEFDFIKYLFKNNTCMIVISLSQLLLACVWRLLLFRLVLNFFFCSLGLGFFFFMPAADATVLLSDLKSLWPCYQVIPQFYSHQLKS
jgi:hypothetical protein